MLGADLQVQQQTPLYLATVAVREFIGYRGERSRGPFCRSPIDMFLKTEVGGSSKIEGNLRGSMNVFMGCAWRARYRSAPGAPFKYVELKPIWDLFDPVARGLKAATLPKAEDRAPRAASRRCAGSRACAAACT